MRLSGDRFWHRDVMRLLRDDWNGWDTVEDTPLLGGFSWAISNHRWQLWIHIASDHVRFELGDRIQKKSLFSFYRGSIE